MTTVNIYNQFQQMIRQYAEKFDWDCDFLEFSIENNFGGFLTYEQIIGNFEELVNYIVDNYDKMMQDWMQVEAIY